MTDQSANGASNGDATNGSAAEAEIRASLVVNGQYIKDLSFENPNFVKIMTQSGGTPEITLNLGVQANGAGQDVYEVILSIRAEAKRDGMVAFIVELAYGGAFTITGLPADQLEPVLFIEAPRLLFPFARAIVSDVTRDGGFTPLMLQPIDFVDLYRRRLAEQQAQTGAAVPIIPN